MKENRSDVETKADSKELQSPSRRKAVKKIVGGVTALTAYHVLPVNWSTPIIEQVFLPAHAATSGDVSDDVLVDPSIPVTPGHPDHPDYPHDSNHPDHPHNNPSAVIGSFTTDAIIAPSAVIDVELTLNRVAQYTWTLTNLANGSSHTLTNTNQTIPTTVIPQFIVEGSAGDTVELTVTDSVGSSPITKQYVIDALAPPVHTVELYVDSNNALSIRATPPSYVIDTSDTWNIVFLIGGTPITGTEQNNLPMTHDGTGLGISSVIPGPTFSVTVTYNLNSYTPAGNKTVTVP